MPKPRIHLQRVDVSEQAELAAALRPYLAELAEIAGERDAAVALDYQYLPLYWTEPGREPYWITIDSGRVGFVLANTHVYRPTSAWSVSEFVIDMAWRRKGLGMEAGCALLALHEGPWEVPILPGHSVALRFWRRVLDQCAPGRFEQLPSGAVPDWDGTLFVASPGAASSARRG